MFRYQSNKQAFVIAVCVILLCLICLTGATLALFTSNPDDGTIGVITTAGVVKIDVVDTSADENSLIDQILQFQTSADQKTILFEPGAVFFTQGFKVKNLGDIPVNYRLSVSKDEAIDQAAFDEAFEVWISKSNTDITGAERISSFNGRLEVNSSSETYYLFIKMREDAGNEFQGKSYSGIGITVYAVQGNVEIKE